MSKLGENGIISSANRANLIIFAFSAKLFAGISKYFVESGPTGHSKFRNVDTPQISQGYIQGWKCRGKNTPPPLPLRSRTVHCTVYNMATLEQDLILILMCLLWINSGEILIVVVAPPLGTLGFTKMDEFSENFQPARFTVPSIHPLVVCWANPNFWPIFHWCF